MARGWKREIERMVVATGMADALARLRHPATGILAYHNVVPTGEPLAGDASLHLDQRVFADQLDFLLERCDVVPLECLMKGDDGSARLRVAVTFDDAYGGAMTVGLEELRVRGLPGTVFVPPGLLGARGFWWDLLAPSRGNPLAADVRRHALETLQGRQDRVLEWARSSAHSIGDLPAHARPVDETTLLRVAAQTGITLGAHTWSHPNLVALAPSEMREEMEESRNWLRARAPRHVDWFAYPYGLCNDEVVAGAAQCFEAAVLIEGGLAQSQGHWLAPPHAVPRLNIPRGLTLDGLALRLAGLRR